jgi:hypothetical protein
MMNSIEILSAVGIQSMLWIADTSEHGSHLDVSCLG